AKEIYEQTQLYIQYNGSTEDNFAELDSQSVLARSTYKIPPALVLSRDIRYSTSIRSKAILSFVGTIEPEWIEHPIKRQLKINSKEETRLNTCRRTCFILFKPFARQIRSKLNSLLGTDCLTTKISSITFNNVIKSPFELLKFCGIDFNKVVVFKTLKIDDRAIRSAPQL
ncbi:unnamed protein product, partial [Rotaria sp. Silwood1]